jgi:hypothetical protein
MSTEIERAVSKELAVPAYLKDVKGNDGLEAVSNSDLVLPRLMICQSLSDQRNRQKPNFIPGLEEGNLFNSVTSDIYGEKVEVIPIIFSRSRIYFRSRESGGGILCQSFNAIDGGTISPTCDACPNSRWDGEGKPPACTYYMNFASILLKDSNLLAISCKATALKAGKTWVTRLKLFNKPAYVQVYEYKTVQATSPKGAYYVPTITFKRWASEEEAKFAQVQYNSIKGQTIKTDELDEEGEENTPF